MIKEGTLATNRLVGIYEKKTSKDTDVGRARRQATDYTRTQRLLLGILLPAAILILWQVSASQGWIKETLFSSPAQIASEFVRLTVNGDLLEGLKVSLIRAGLGFLIGASLGLGLGILVGMSKLCEAIVDPTVQLLRAIPVLAILPLFMLWFGFGELSKILIVTFGSFFFLYINTFAGVRNVDKKLYEVTRVLEFNRFSRLTKLIIPAALPSILVGLRLSLSIAWMCLLVAELMGADQGVGFMMQYARMNMQTGVVFVGVVIFAVVGKLIDSLVRLLERRLLKWRDSFDG
jgi:sulfonate transport system permease protein